MEEMSFVKAIKHFFEPDSRKVEIAEFKALTHKDKVELRDELVKIGYSIPLIQEPAVTAPS